MKNIKSKINFLTKLILHNCVRHISITKKNILILNNTYQQNVPDIIYDKIIYTKKRITFKTVF